MDLNRVIGYKGGLPWPPNPEDFKWFKEFTMDRTIVVGRTTFESLPVLKNRDIVVISNFFTDISAEAIFNYYEKYRNRCSNLYLRRADSDIDREFPDAIIAGGAMTYKTFLPQCSDLYMTYMIDTYEGDTFMPEFEDLFPNSNIFREAKDHWVVRYWK